MNRVSKLVLLLASALILGCSTPAIVTPKPDVRPVATSNQKIQSETKQVKTLTGRSREVTKSLRADLEAGKIVEAKAKADQLQQIAEEVDQHVVTLEELGKGQEQEIVRLGGQIETSHKNEQALATWKKDNEDVVKQVNKYWGLGAFAYGFKVLFRHLFIAAIVLVVIGGLLWFFVPAAVPFIRMIGAFFAGLFNKARVVITGLFRKR